MDELIKRAGADAAGKAAVTAASVAAGAQRLPTWPPSPEPAGDIFHLCLSTDELSLAAFTSSRIYTASVASLWAGDAAAWVRPAFCIQCDLSPFAV